MTCVLTIWMIFECDRWSFETADFWNIETNQILSFFLPDIIPKIKILALQVKNNTSEFNHFVDSV